MVKTQDKMRALRVALHFPVLLWVLLAQGGSVAISRAISAYLRHDHRLGDAGVTWPSLGVLRVVFRRRWLANVV
jgi:hypothetical protein